MKIIINETQYSLIQNLLAEAKRNYKTNSERKYNTNNLDKGIQEFLGNMILNIFDCLVIGKGITFVCDGMGVRVVLKLVSENNNTYNFSVIEDDDNFLKGNKKVSLKLNPGNGEDSLNEYNLNKDIISSDNKTTFNLKFKGNGGFLVLNNIKYCYSNNLPNDNIDDVDTTDTTDTTDSQVDNDVENSGDSQDVKELQQDGKLSLEMILKDKNLKNAFYQQPKLWDLFIAELKGKTAVGKGIINVVSIVSKYEKRKTFKSLGGEFDRGQVSFSFLGSYKVSYDTKFYEFNSFDNREFRCKVLDVKLGEQPKLSGRLNKDGTLYFELKLLNKIDEIEDGFLCSLEIIKVKGSVINRYPYENNVKIKIIRGDKSNGYKPYY